MTGKLNTKLDANQVLRESFDADTQSLKVKQAGGVLVPEQYDSIELTYVPSGNGVGEIQTATYKLAGGTIATLTLTYDGSNRLATVTRS